MSRRCNGSRSPVRRKLSLWLSSKRSRSFGQGVVRGVEASVGEEPSMATGMLSCRVWTSERVGECLEEGSSTAEGGIGINGEDDVPKRSPGSTSVKPQSGMCCSPWATKSSESGERPSR